MRIGLHSCYVLHRRPYRESSLLLEVFSRQWGRVSLVARGARRVTRRRVPLQLFQRLLLGWSGKSELKTLGRFEQEGAVTFLSGGSCLSGFYLNELLLRLLAREDPHPELFDAYAGALWKLHEGQGIEYLLRTFELSLLRSLGYGLSLDRDAVSGEQIREDREYYYQVDRGPSSEDPGEDCIRISGRALCLLSSGASQCSESLLRESRRLLRYNLHHRLGGRELGSRRLYRDFLSLGQPGPAQIAASGAVLGSGE